MFVEKVGSPTARGFDEIRLMCHLIVHVVLLYPVTRDDIAMYQVEPPDINKSPPLNSPLLHTLLAIVIDPSKPHSAQGRLLIPFTHIITPSPCQSIAI